MRSTIFTIGLALTFTMLWQLAPCADDIWMTQYDQPFVFECPDNHHLKSINSVHSNGKEDRVFNFMCEMAPAATSLAGCEWGDFANDYDEFLEFQCPNEGIISGIESVHSNRQEDRIYKFKCCQPAGMLTHACEYTDFINKYDNPLSYTVPDGMVLRGVTSIHSNSKEDRIFRFDICKLDEGAPLVQGPGIGR